MFRKIKEIVDKGDRFLITSHIDPDGDAVGSVLSLYWALNSIGKHPSLYLKDPMPYNYAFLPHPASMAVEFPSGPFDAVFVVDCGSLSRVGEGYERLADMGRLVNIDHHKTNEAFGIVNLIDETACCTAELLYFLYEFLALPVSTDMALGIYTAILTDTGSFRFENTNSNAFIIAEQMVRAGVQPAYVSQMVYNSHPKERFILLGLVLSGLQTFNDDTVAMVHVTEQMFASAHATKELTDGFVEYVKEIRGVEVAVLLREVRGGFKVSMRSKGMIDVARACALFDGGGHKNAAGCTVEGTLEDVEGRLKEALNIE